MSKIQLKNVSNMNQGIPSGPLDGRLNMREAGALNESGMLDDSGLIDESGLWLLSAEYDYVVVQSGPFSLRYLVMWKIEDISGESTARIYARLDDEGARAYTSGDLGDPVSNSDPGHYDYLTQTITSCNLSQDGFIMGSCVISCRYFPLGRDGVHDPDGTPRPDQCYGSFSYEIKELRKQ